MILGRILGLAALIVGVATLPAHGYNDEQHQGLVALAYKAMVAAALESGCASPIEFAGLPPEGLRSFPGAEACTLDEPACLARWESFLEELERSILFLRSVDSSLPPAGPGCIPFWEGAGRLGEVTLAVNADHGRSSSCGLELASIAVPGASARVCSAPARLCHARSIYQFLAAEDHAGDVLGYRATEPDHDVSVTGIGFKPTSAAGAGRAVHARIRRISGDSGNVDVR